MLTSKKATYVAILISQKLVPSKVFFTINSRVNRLSRFTKHIAFFFMRS
jgi:hypothetical protein